MLDKNKDTIEILKWYWGEKKVHDWITKATNHYNMALEIEESEKQSI